MKTGNPLMIRRGRRHHLDVIMHDADQPEGAQEFRMSMFRLRGVDVIRAQSLWDDLIEMYVTGGKHLPPVDDQPVIVSKGACQLVAYLFTAQRDPDNGYTVEDLFAMMCSDRLLMQMQELFIAVLPAPPPEQASDDGMPREGLVFVDPLSSGATP